MLKVFQSLEVKKKRIKQKFMRTSTVRWEEILDRTIFQKPDEESVSRKRKCSTVSVAIQRFGIVRMES